MIPEIQEACIYSFLLEKPKCLRVLRLMIENATAAKASKIIKALPKNL